MSIHKVFSLSMQIHIQEYSLTHEQVTYVLAQLGVLTYIHSHIHWLTEHSFSKLPTNSFSFRHIYIHTYMLTYSLLNTSKLKHALNVMPMPIDSVTQEHRYIHSDAPPHTFTYTLTLALYKSETCLCRYLYANVFISSMKLKYSLIENILTCTHTHIHISLTQIQSPVIQLTAVSLITQSLTETY